MFIGLREGARLAVSEVVGAILEAEGVGLRVGEAILVLISELLLARAVLW
jgi:hypothetical protein